MEELAGNFGWLTEDYEEDSNQQLNLEQVGMYGKLNVPGITAFLEEPLWLVT